LFLWLLSGDRLLVLALPRGFSEDSESGWKWVGAGVCSISPNRSKNRRLLPGSGVDVLGPGLYVLPTCVSLVTFALAVLTISNTRYRGCVVETGISPSRTLRNVLSRIGFWNPSERRLLTTVKYVISLAVYAGTRINRIPFKTILNSWSTFRSAVRSRFCSWILLRVSSAIW